MSRTSRHSLTLENGLHAITETLERTMSAEVLSGTPGLFQSLDARVKLWGVLCLLVAAGLSHRLAVIAAIYLAVLALGWASAVPLDSLVRRVWLSLPFFTGIIALPALFLTPGPPLLQLPLGLILTRTGMMTALFLLLRVSTSVSLSLLLILTTPWNTVLSALGILRVPDVFVLMLGMTYRYIYLLLHITNDMFLSRRSRVVGRLSVADNQKMIASVAGTLLGKSLNLGSEVYVAMQSRGFHGRHVTLRPFHMHARDWVWAILLSGFAAASIWVGR
jgi:cobalt/nickel transport system permease protein